MIYDYAVIGGGIVGLSVALNILESESSAKVLILEKEDSLASHQTSHNSGVIHAGIYYDPKSFKAKLCREGLVSTQNFCDEHNIPYETCGKLIVATNALEEKRINDLFDRAKANRIYLKKINRKQLIDIEPHITGTKALLSPKTGLVDYKKIALKMAEVIQKKDANIVFDSNVKKIKETSSHVEILDQNQEWLTKKLIVCGGLQADRLANIAGLKTNFKIIPFRGEYFKLPSSKNNIVKHHIYPAPDPTLPFLGVHLTKMIDGSVTLGPNAVLGFSREGYAKGSLNIGDTSSFLAYPAFWKLLWMHRHHAFHEMKTSLSRSIYLNDCQKYCPELKLSDLLPYRAGIRAQVVKDNGKIEHDFLFGETSRMLHVFNAPSPAATAAIPIGRMIVSKLIRR